MKISMWDKNQILFTKEEFFLLVDKDFGFKFIVNGKAKEIEEYEAKIFSIGENVPIRANIHKLFNPVVKRIFPDPWNKSLIIPIFKSGDKNNPSNYWTTMIIPLLAKLYNVILKNKISILLESEGKWARGQAGFRRHHSTMNHLVMLRSIVKECIIVNQYILLHYGLWKISDIVPRNSQWNRLKEIKVPL